MTNEERISKLEQAVQNFKLITAGIDQLDGGFPKLENRASLEERLAHLEELHQNFKIRGGDNCNAEGSLESGYCVNVKCPSIDSV